MAEQLSIELVVELTEPITGTITSDAPTPTHRFTGWMQLHTALEAICSPGGRLDRAPTRGDSNDG